MSQSKTPLSNLFVVDLTEALAGPFCGMVLGDLGADVVKVERPGRGDQSRGYGPPFVAEESAYFMSLNRNKRSLVLDLTADSGQEIMQRLLLKADVFLLNLPRQSSWKKYGFDYATVSTNNPGIIVAAISGYGHTGARAGEPGYDVIAQAEAGTMSLTGEPDGVPMRFPTPMADMTTGLYALVGILAALQARSQTGKGQMLDLSLLECQLSWLTNLVPAALLTGSLLAELAMLTRCWSLTAFTRLAIEHLWSAWVLILSGDDSAPPSNALIWLKIPDSLAMRTGYVTGSS